MKDVMPNEPLRREYKPLPKWRVWLPTALFLIAALSVLVGYAGLATRLVAAEEKLRQCEDRHVGE